jgi:hypothetical protein
VTFFGLFLTPVFYVLLRSRRANSLHRAAHAAGEQGASEGGNFGEAKPAAKAGDA